MPDMTDLERLKLLTLETDDGAACEGCAVPVSARQYTDEQLAEYLAMADGDVNAAAYGILLRKSQSTAATLGGMTLADQSAYYLRLAAQARHNRGRALERADAPTR